MNTFFQILNFQNLILAQDENTEPETTKELPNEESSTEESSSETTPGESLPGDATEASPTDVPSDTSLDNAESATQAAGWSKLFQRSS